MRLSVLNFGCDACCTGRSAKKGSFEILSWGQDEVPGGGHLETPV
jgi:hypothetical protein